MSEPQKDFGRGDDRFQRIDSYNNESKYNCFHMVALPVTLSVALGAALVILVKPFFRR